jgi:hypothetical protein
MLLSFRAYMFYDSRPSDDWSTTLEYSIDADISSGIVEAAALAFADGLSEMLLNNVIIDRVVVSTWEPDSEPYDPDSLRVVPVGINGQNAFAFTTPADDDLVVFIRKSVVTGRTGKMQLRGCFTVSALETESGSWTFTALAQTEMETDTAAAWDLWAGTDPPVLIGVVLLDTIYPAVAEGTKQIPVKVYTDIPSVRQVNGLVVVGPNERQDTQ